jgi:murein L,D-transpeptidase YcbB/YkuD
MWMTIQLCVGRALRVLVPSLLITVVSFAAPAQDAGTNTQNEIRRLVGDANWRPQRASLDWQALREFYSERGDQPAWSSNDQSEQALQVLIHADHEGLKPAAYNAFEIKRPSSGDAASSARFDILLTNSLLRYAHDVREGRIAPEAAYDDASLPRQHYNTDSELNAALKNGTLQDYLSSLPPPHEGYRALRNYLDSYRRIAAAGGWPKIPEGAGSAAMGKRTRQLLSERLAIEEGGSESLNQAIGDFQAHHGLGVTGALDERTLQELNVDANTRVQQIAMNMERWRWLPRQLPSRFVEVNVPAAMLAVYDSGHQVMTSRVVVGREKDPTPLLHADATSITVNPTWEIPTKIARKEILTKLRTNPSYLESHHIEFVSHSPLRLRQLPGPENALGALKIDMPNRFDVYLHDTPSQSAFDRAARDESHGCMRVEQIMALASYALSGNTDAAASDLQNAIATRETQKIPLPSALPVYVLYWTVTPGSDGKAQFSPDIYDRDARLQDAIKNKVAAAKVSML